MMWEVAMPIVCIVGMLSTGFLLFWGIETVRQNARSQCSPYTENEPRAVTSSATSEAADDVAERQSRRDVTFAWTVFAIANQWGPEEAADRIVAKLRDYRGCLTGNVEKLLDEQYNDIVALQVLGGGPWHQGYCSGQRIEIINLRRKLRECIMGVNEKDAI